MSKQRGEELLELDEEGQVQQPIKKEQVSTKTNKPLMAMALVSIVTLFAVVCGIWYVNGNKVAEVKVGGEDYLYPRRCVVFGYGAVAQSTLPEIYKHANIKKFLLIDQRIIANEELAPLKNIPYEVRRENFPLGTLYQRANEIIQDGDIVMGLLGCAKIMEIIRACGNNKKDVIYIDAALQDYTEDPSGSEYKLYKEMWDYRDKEKPKFTGCVDAGANPGMITHFAILGLYGMAQSAIDRKVHDADQIKKYLDEKNIKALANILKVDAIHVSDHDCLEPRDPKAFEGYNANTWCVGAFTAEWNIPAEISLGTADREYFESHHYRKTPDADPEHVFCPYPTFLKTIGPEEGIFTGKAISHPETYEISKIFRSEGHVPTILFVYKPSRLARISQNRPDRLNYPPKLMMESNCGPMTGNETMGATLFSRRTDIPPRMYQSALTAKQTRQVGSTTNPTTLQVTAGLVSHLMLMLKNPNKGLCQPGDFDSYEIMKIAKQYLGTVWDCDYKGEWISAKWEDLLSTQAAMDDDL